MENDTKIARKRPENIPARIRELDDSIAGLDERIEKNRADLERNNANLTLKIAELCKVTLQNGRHSKR